MICKFLYYCAYMVTSPDSYQFAEGAYIQAENEEHASICMKDFFQRHSMTAEILSVRWVPHFLIASEDQYPKSKLYDQPIRPFDEALDFP